VVQVDEHGVFEAKFAAYCAEHDISIDRIEAYNPMKNAKGERPHKTLRDRLRAVCPTGRLDLWHTVVLAVFAAYNRAYNRNLGTSPFHMLRGYSPINRLTPRAVAPAEATGCSAEQWLACLAAVHEQLELRNLITSYVQRAEENERHPATVPTFAPGDSVFLFFPTRPTKSHTFFRPGYVVLSADGPDYYLVAKRLAGGKQSPPERVRVSRLRPFNASRTPDGGISLSNDLKPDHFIVERIAAHYRDETGRYFFYPKYEGVEPSDTDPPAVLSDLTRNCKADLVAYCKAHDIPFSRVERQRKAESAALITGSS